MLHAGLLATDMDHRKSAAWVKKSSAPTNDLPEFDATFYFDSNVIISAYLTDIMEANDDALLAAALGDIARARGMSEIAQSVGITREVLDKELRPGEIAP